MARSSLASNPRGIMIDIGGRRMQLVRAGPHGVRPTVLLEAGSFGFSADWAAVQAKLAERGVYSIAYDRAGLGLSDPGPAPRDGLAIAADLEALLDAAGEEGPFIVVGHSMAGLHVHLFAGRNPRRVAGVVLVDAVTPQGCDNAFERRIVAHFTLASRLAAWAAGLGLFKLAHAIGDRIGLPAEAAPQKRWAFTRGAHNRVAAEEVIQWETAAAQARALGELDPGWPVAVVTAGPVHGEHPKRTIHGEPARRSRFGYSEHVQKARHATLLGMTYAEAVVRAVLHVREASLKA